MNRSSGLKTDSIKVSEEVIAKIARSAVNNVDGVLGLSEPKKCLFPFFVRSAGSPVRIKMNGGAAEVALSIKVSDSCKVKAAAEKIQTQVKEDVQNMTGIAVTKVSVFVKDIVFGNE